MSKRIHIATIPFDAITSEGVLSFVEEHVRNEKQVYITTPNPEMVLEAQKNPEFSSILKKASLSLPDGIGILWASYYLSLPLPKGKIRQFAQLMGTLIDIVRNSPKIKKALPERVTGSDTLFKIVDRAQETKWRIFLLGARPGVANRAIHKLLEHYPKAIFAGSHSGSPEKDEESEIVEMINRAQPDILFVAYGSPAQELWIHRNLPKLKTVKVAIGVGGAIDFAAGVKKRAPRLMQKIGLEWFYRLLIQPKRIRRIYNATFVFVRVIERCKRMA